MSTTRISHGWPEITSAVNPRAYGQRKLGFGYYMFATPYLAAKPMLEVPTRSAVSGRDLQARLLGRTRSQQNRATSSRPEPRAPVFKRNPDEQTSSRPWTTVIVCILSLGPSAYIALPQKLRRAPAGAIHVAREHMNGCRMWADELVQAPMPHASPRATEHARAQSAARATSRFRLEAHLLRQSRTHPKALAQVCFVAIMLLLTLLLLLLLFHTPSRRDASAHTHGRSARGTGGRGLGHALYNRLWCKRSLFTCRACSGP